MYRSSPLQSRPLPRPLSAKRKRGANRREEEVAWSEAGGRIADVVGGEAGEAEAATVALAAGGAVGSGS